MQNAIKEIARFSNVNTIQAKDIHHYQLDVIALPKYVFQASPTIPIYKTIIKHKTLIETSLHLHTHIECVCQDTGIIWAASLPCPMPFKAEMTHPLATLGNVERFIQAYQRTGQPVSALHENVLAGMLITLLRYKNWMYCRDSVKANHRLQTVNKKSLTYAISYFYNAEARVEKITPLPIINLLENSQEDITQQLLSFINICKGKDNTIELRHIQPSKKNPSVNVYVRTSKAAQESVTLRKTIKTINSTISSWFDKTQATAIQKQQYTTIYQQVKMLGVITDEQKTILVQDIKTLFNDTIETQAIATLIIKKANTDVIQNDLLSFSAIIHKEQQEQDGTDKNNDNAWDSMKQKMLSRLAKIAR
jgi:hypothetical protein